MARRRPLPGIRFEGRTPPRRDPLPRMDIAAFVGFAASGPIDVPVPIEDPRQFAMVFGADLALPAPAGASAPPTAHLGATVRAFFDNGGRRCWIVRVAREASVNTFTIPGLFLSTGSPQLDPATMTARSEGSWSDGLLVRTNLVATPLALGGVNPPASPDPDFTVDIDGISARDLVEGDLVRVTWADVEPSLYLFIRRIAAAPASVGTNARRLAGPTLWLAGDQRRDPPPASLLVGNVAAERLTFDLTVLDRDGSSLWTLPRLGFAPEHPRYVGALPADKTLFEAAAEAEDAPRPHGEWADLWREASLPRFPLAGTDGAIYLPATMKAVLSAGVGPDIPPGTALERNGLGTFGTPLFLDPAIADIGVRDIINTADTIRYSGSTARPLTGIHAVLAVDEVTMVAVPDGVHYHWEKIGEGGPSSPLASSPLAHPEWWRWLDCRVPPPDPLPPAGSGFIDCASSEPIAPPVLTAGPVVDATYELTWTSHAGASVEIEEASDPAWRDATVIPHTTGNSLTFYHRPAGDHLYRARFVVGARTSDWSAGIVVRVRSETESCVAREPDDDRVLLAVQRALVRMCAAKADRVALLSLPGHYRDAAAIAHVAALSSEVDGPAQSYAAIWHPWLIGRASDAGELRTSPPDGAMAGVMAARALARGAWVAPANETLNRVVALEPPMPAESRQALQDAAINLIRQEPRGFVCLNADTLSQDDDVRPLNVRRLLILLRRSALRAGNRFTFEPHGERLRRAVKRGFEVMLEELFTRGAFAGRRSADAFRVSTDDSLNPRASVEAGRFLAEIRVAPSRPLSFLTVRLVQRGETTVAQEVR
jgi:hypothetical protein